MSGNLDVLVGPMFSGKSTELLRRLFVEASVGTKCLYINSTRDTRTPENYSTHNPLYQEKLEKQNGVDMLSVSNLKDVDAEYLKEYSVIGVDEGQFFKDLVVEIKKWVEVLEKHVIVAGLDGNFRREAFGQMIDLIPISESVTKLQAKCMCGRNAPFTHKKQGDQNTEIQVGGKDIYTAKCRKCYNETSPTEVSDNTDMLTREVFKIWKKFNDPDLFVNLVTILSTCGKMYNHINTKCKNDILIEWDKCGIRIRKDHGSYLYDFYFGNLRCETTELNKLVEAIKVNKHFF